MKDMYYDVFLISQTLTGNLDRPIKIFLSKTFSDAIVLFENEILCKDKIQTYKLHKIGEIRKCKLETVRPIFVRDGYNTYANMQLNISHNDWKEEIKRIKQARLKFDDDKKEALKILFDGVEV